MRLDKIALIFAFAAVLCAAGLAAGSAEEPMSYGLTLPSSKEPEGGKPIEGRGGDVVLPANPLWAVRLGELPATRDRPIFSPSRRPRAPPPVLLAAPPPPPKPAAPREPDRPPLALLGTIVSPSLQIAIFREEATSETRRLKTGDDYKGWALRSVTSREARFEGRNQTAVLALPPPEAAAVNSALVGESDLPARHRKR